MSSNYHSRSPWSRSSAKMIKGLEHLLWEQAERAGPVQPREEMTEETSMSISTCREVTEDGPRLCSMVLSNRTRGSSKDWCTGSSSWVWGRTSSLCATKPSRRWPREGVESSKDCLHANLCPVLCSDPAWTGWTRQATMVLSNLTHSMITRIVLCFLLVFTL